MMWAANQKPRKNTENKNPSVEKPLIKTGENLINSDGVGGDLVYVLRKKQLNRDNIMR